MIEYKYLFGDGTRFELGVDEHGQSSPDDPEVIPEWARLDCHRCDHCALPKDYMEVRATLSTGDGPNVIDLSVSKQVFPEDFTIYLNPERFAELARALAELYVANVGLIKIHRDALLVCGCRFIQSVLMVLYGPTR